MSVRTIISIDEEKCNGCGLCIPNCPEGAMQVIDGKARLISDLFCDGLGACVGYCPEGAITLDERRRSPTTSRAPWRTSPPTGRGTIKAHLEHLAAHGEERLLSQALDWLRGAGIAAPEGFSGAAGTPAATGSRVPRAAAVDTAPRLSTLTNWPIQMHLLSPMAPRFTGADVLLSADCVAYAVGSFHSSMLEGKALAIACPKLDEGKDIYREAHCADRSRADRLPDGRDDAGPLLPRAPRPRAAGARPGAPLDSRERRGGIHRRRLHSVRAGPLVT